MPFVGFTWYSLTDQVDWDTALRENNGRVTQVGSLDLDRNIRPVGEAYRKLILNWRDILPTESTGLAIAYETDLFRCFDWTRRLCYGSAFRCRGESKLPKKMLTS